MNKFEDLGLNNQLYKAIQKLGYSNPTQIQEESIPYILEGRDLIGESATGSGKTLAFGCGVIGKSEPRKGIQALILEPTRELADQVKDSLKEIASGKKLNIYAIFGGVSISNQIQNLKKAEVIVATPGRLLDHLERKTIDLSDVSMVVLDEADRMFDMGFIDDVEKIIRQCPKRNQTLFFSATMSSEVIRLASKYMNNPKKVFAEKMVDPSKLSQVYVQVAGNMKLTCLKSMIEEDFEKGLSMVFCNTRKATDFVSDGLKSHGINSSSIHGGLSQNARNRTMNRFHREGTKVLVCTDVAARGLHIDNVSKVYNYDLPADPNDYIHRIGRTARAGESGKVINILADRDRGSFSKILRTYRKFNIEDIGQFHSTKRIMPANDNRNESQFEYANSGYRLDNNSSDNKSSNNDSKYNGNDRGHKKFNDNSSRNSTRNNDYKKKSSKPGSKKYGDKNYSDKKPKNKYGNSRGSNFGKPGDNKGYPKKSYGNKNGKSQGGYGRSERRPSNNSSGGHKRY